MSRVEEMMQKMLKKFDTTDQNVNEMCTELSEIGKKVDARTVNTIQNLKNDGHCMSITTRGGKQTIDPPMPSDVEKVVETYGDEIEVTEETKNAIEKEAEIAQKVVPMPRPPPPFPQSHTFGRGAEVFSKEKLGTTLYTEKKRHAQKTEKRKLAPGDLVLFYKSRLCYFPGRSKSQWTGPFRVTQVSPHKVVELEKRSGTKFKADERRIKSYMGNSESVNAVIEEWHLDEV
uniref:Integrase core domain containing protein n=1 Tax=Solanum tuberosum TaxID=4113 RepID=M1E0X9_SOLTU